jgi:hypothetical protein
LLGHAAEAESDRAVCRFHVFDGLTFHLGTLDRSGDFSREAVASAIARLGGKQVGGGCRVW